MKPETATLVMLMIITLLLLWNGTMLRKMIAMLKPPRLLVPNDLDLTDLKPGPIIRNDPPPQTYKPGDRVRAKATAGFHRGAVGKVVFQEPSGQRCWVERDGAGSPCFYYNYELEPEKA